MDKANLNRWAYQLTNETEARDKHNEQISKSNKFLPFRLEAIESNGWHNGTMTKSLGFWQKSSEYVV